MGMTRTRWRVVVGAAVAVGAVAAGHAWAVSAVDVAVEPSAAGAVATGTSAPRVKVVWLPTGGCAATRSLTDSTGSTGGQGRRPRVASDPDTVRLTWLPGLNANWSNCVARTTTAAAAVAHRLADCINDSKPFPDGPISCPADLGLAVVVSLHSRVGWQSVQVDTTGCATLIAPGFTPRRAGDDLVADLREPGPAAWPGAAS